VNALVLVMLGTDHHPFGRLVDWTDDLALELGPGTRFLVQHGVSRAPLIAEGREHLPHDEIESLLARADAVVCHGGPGTIMDARNAGHVPICVPRDPARGEHVDDHQQRFVAIVDRAGVVTEARSRAELAQAVHAAIRRHRARTAVLVGAGVVGTAPEAADRSCLRLARELDPLCGSRPTRRSSVRQAFLSRVLR